MNAGDLQPIFIVGCQRSGTTFLGSLLGADAGTIAIPEAQFIADLAPADPDAVLDLAGVIDSVVAHYRFGIWNFDLKGERPAGRGRYADAIRWLVRRYAIAEGKPDAVRWIDHQPGHVREMAELRAHFPGLQAVHIVRDGRAVAASVMPLAWGPNTIHTAANFWAQRTAMGMGLRDWMADGRWHQVRYEDVVRDTEATIRPLADALGLDYTPAMLEGSGFRVPAFTQNQHALVGKRPDPARLDSWRRALTPREIEMFEGLVGPLLTYLGYARDFGHAARLPSTREKVRLTLIDQLKAIRNRRRFDARVDAFRS